MSLDGFVAGPNHNMDWLPAEATNRPGLVEEYISTLGAILGGRNGWDAFPDSTAPYGGAWSDPLDEVNFRYHPIATPEVTLAGSSAV